MVEVIDDDVVKVLREKTPAERLEIAFAMWRSTRNLLIATVSDAHPEWSSARVAEEVARRLSHGAC